MATTDEIMAGPIEAYVAPKNTAAPDIDEAPSATWLLIGSQGSKNITEDGVRLIMEDSKEKWRGLGSTGPQKMFRTAEDSRVQFQLADLTLEQLAYALGGEGDSSPALITSVAAGASIPGTKALNLLRGFDFTEVALLLRKADSPYNPALNMQFWIPRCVADGNIEIVWVKGTPALVDFSYELLDDPTNGFGKFLAQTAVATS